MSKRFPTFGKILSVFRWFLEALKHLYQNSGPTWQISPWWPADLWVAKQHSLLRLLSVAVAERLDIVPLIKNLSHEQRGFYGFRLRRLVRRMKDGTSLVDALEQTPNVLPNETVLAIRIGSESGTLPAIFESLLENQGNASVRVGGKLRQTWFYFAGTFLFGGAILTFLLIKIVPQFNAIYNDFQLEIPALLRGVIGASNTLGELLPFVPFIALILFGLWWSRAAHRFFRRGLIASLLSLLAIAMEAGRPVARVISSLARYHFDKSLRHKLLFVRNEIEQGVDVWTSMAEAQLLSTAEAHALASASSPEVRIWMLRRLARLKQDRTARRREIMASFIEPVVVLLFASVVLIIAVAMLSPLFDLVQALA